ncbi:MAG: HAD-IB family hydrolase, partial [Actinomycetota bacterium]
YLGADEDRMARMRESALRVTVGWHRDHILRLVRETMDEVIDPIVYEEALELIRDHKAQGRRVFIISASPEEIVVPLTKYLGADEAIATRPRTDTDGRYTGEIEFYSYGPFKAEAMQRVAERDGLDLARCWGYSDSATDIPMLEAVGHPVAVNPDRVLAEYAAEQGWEIRLFAEPVSLRSRVSMPTPAATAAVSGGLAALVGGAVAWWWLRREPPPSRWTRAGRRLGSALTDGVAAGRRLVRLP